MKATKTVFSILSIAMLLAACNSIDFKKTKGGVPYKIIPSKSGDKIVEGNIVKYQMTVKVKDSVLFNSNESFPRYEQVGPATNNYSNPIMEILTKAKTGDSIYFVQAVDSFIAHDPNIVKQTPFRNGDQLKTMIRITKVFRTPAEAQTDVMQEREAYGARMQKQNMDKIKNDPAIQAQLKKDDKAISDYLAANHIQAQKTDMGTYVQVLTPGQGPKPGDGKFAILKYSGSDFAGKVFDSNDKPGAQLLPLQIGKGGTIPGFEDGVKELTKGEKAKLYIPSALAYGAQGRMPAIQPNENLVFTIEVVDITDNYNPKQSMPIKVDTTQKHK